MPETAGLEDFLRWLDREPPTFTLLAVKAPLGLVTGLLADGRGPERVLEQVTVHRSESEGKVADAGAGPGTEEEWLAVVRLRDDPWTFVYGADIASPDIASPDIASPDIASPEDDPSSTDSPSPEGASSVRVAAGSDGEDPGQPCFETEAADLSESLGTDALVVRVGPAEDGTGSVVCCQVFVEGDCVERLEWCLGQPFRRFESGLRDRPPELGESAPVGFEFLDRTLRDRGIYVPSCRIVGRGDSAALAVAGIDPARIERADLLCLPAEVPWPEDETLDLRIRTVPDEGDPPPATPGSGPMAAASPSSDFASAAGGDEAAASSSEAPDGHPGTGNGGSESRSPESRSKEGQPAKRRGFFSRLFGRS